MKKIIKNGLMHLIKVRVSYILIITKSVKTSGHQLSWQSNRLLICGSQVRSLHGSLKLLAKNKELFFNTVPIVQRQSARLWIWLSSVRSRLGTLGVGNQLPAPFLFMAICQKLCACSSSGQSNGLRIRRQEVRILSDASKTKKFLKKSCNIEAYRIFYLTTVICV